MRSVPTIVVWTNTVTRSCSRARSSRAFRSAVLKTRHGTPRSETPSTMADQISWCHRTPMALCHSMSCAGSGSCQVVALHRTPSAWTPAIITLPYWQKEMRVLVTGGAGFIGAGILSAPAIAVSLSHTRQCGLSESMFHRCRRYYTECRQLHVCAQRHQGYKSHVLPPSEI